MKTMVNVRTVNVLTAATPLLGPSEHRIGVVIASPLTNRFVISPDPDVALGRGITLYPAGGVWEAYEYQWGNALNQPFFAISAVAPQNVTVMEILKAL